MVSLVIVYVIALEFEASSDLFWAPLISFSEFDDFLFE
jgi:hypothetical protein